MSLQDLKQFIHSKEFEQKTELCEILEEEGSDKSSNWHNYSSVYHKLFSHLRQKPIKFFELGIFHGASARAWRRYFPYAEITLADVDANYLIQGERMVSYHCDQENIQSIEKLWSNFGDKDFFDIMIEDGKHEFHSNYCFLLNSIRMLKPGGIFIVEDLTSHTWNNFANLADIKEHLNVSEFLMLDIPNSHNSIDNRLIVVKK